MADMGDPGEVVVENASVDSPINAPISDNPAPKPRKTRAKRENPSPESSKSEESSLFEDLDPNPAQIVRSDGLPALDVDLTPDQKREFLDLIHKEMSLAERAKQLATLARFTDTKRAPVALRALMEMNLLDGMRENKPTEATPLFSLPADAKMAVLVQKVEK